MGPIRVVQDAQGNVYVVGDVDTDIVPVTAGAFQTKFNATTCGSYQNGYFGTPQPIPCPHGFAVKISAVWLYHLSDVTYVEGSQDDGTTPVGVDFSGDLFLLVNSSSPDFPSTGSMSGLPPTGNGGNYFILSRRRMAPGCSSATNLVFPEIRAPAPSMRLC